MKCFVLLLCMLPGILHVHGQEIVSEKKNAFAKKDKCPKAYFGVATGVNNPNGILGFNVAIPIKFVSVCGGVGVSTWGNKIFAEGRYYLKPCQQGFAFGAGITHNTGGEDVTLKHKDTDLGRQNVNVNLAPQTNAYIAAYHFWGLGKRHNRFFGDLGYSVPLQRAHFKQVFPSSGPPQGHLTNDAKDQIHNFSPGGLMVGAGFCFGLQ